MRVTASLRSLLVAAGATPAVIVVERASHRRAAARLTAPRGQTITPASGQVSTVGDGSRASKVHRGARGARGGRKYGVARTAPIQFLRALRVLRGEPCLPSAERPDSTTREPQPTSGTFRSGGVRCAFPPYVVVSARCYAA